MLSGVCSSRCLSNACLLLIYVYILLYMLLITLETQSLNRKVCHLFTNQSEYIFNLYGPQLTIYLLTLKSNRLRSSATEFREHFCPKTIEVQNIAKRFLEFCGRLTVILIFLFSMNITLLVICNTSIRNPGPKLMCKPLTIFYNNVQGLINVRDLACEHPLLNMTKLYKLHGFLYTHAPDVVVLNETWLKKSIHDNEILPPNYKIFRLDRSLSNHPWDPTQPKKYRKNGGGVLIAHRSDLEHTDLILSTQI